VGRGGRDRPPPLRKFLDPPMMALFYRNRVIADESFTPRGYNFRPFCSPELDLDPMTFIDQLDWHSQQIYRLSENEFRTSRLSKVIVSAISKKPMLHADFMALYL